MNLVDEWGVTLAVFLPLLGALAITLTPKGMDGIQKILALASTGAALVIGLMVAFAFEHGEPGMQFEKTISWIPSINANYHIGIDGISLPLIVLSLLVTFLCIIYAYWHIPEPGNTKAFLALILLLETGMNGSFIALDLILFFVFWELVLVPMYFLIGIWGGERRQYAAIKFFLYTLFGSLFMLLGFLALYFQSEPNTFDMIELQQAGVLNLPIGLANLIFGGLALGFAVKVPMWPFHTWLPDAHTEAPTIGSVLLAAVLLKMGTYGFMRIAIPILPEPAQVFAPFIAVLAAIAIVYGALCCLAQTNLKRMIAFSSVGHMGFVMLGIAAMTPEGFNAAVFGMVAHGVITGMLFFLAGSIKERYHTYEMPDLAGMGLKIPRMAGLLAFCAIASLGLPGLAGFWGEVMALLSAYRPLEGLNLTVFRSAMVVGAIGTVLTAGYFLWMLQRVNMGRAPEGSKKHKYADVQRLEMLAWAPLLALILVLGLYPRLIMDTTTSSVTRLTETVLGERAQVAQVADR
ncbi:MAG TPA: NADH-quinone oxidoreductase subunit M [Actinomycetota bacterium]|nr:NADH-quinone oxidoreductase subunit M [Actinomycetota bacterium]